MKNLPNIITIVRILALPFLVYFLLSGTKLSSIIALIIFVIAALTDAIDGYIARKYNLITTLGKLLDPLADKLLVTTVLVSMVSTNEVSAIIVLIILAREFAVTGLRSIAASDGIIIHASKFGKLKTQTQMLALVMLMITRIVPNQAMWMTMSTIVLYIATAITVISGIDYFLKSKNLFLSKSY